MLGVALALAASFCWGVGDFIGGSKSRVLPVLVVLVCSQLVGLLWIGGVALIAQEPVPNAREIVLAALSAVAGTAGLVCFFRAISIGKMSLVVPIAATAAVVPVVVGIATGDRPGPLQLVGMVVALGGAVMASREPGEEGERGSLAAGVLLAALSALFIGFFFLAIDGASDGGAVWASLVNRITSVTLLLAAAAVVRPKLSAARPHLPALAGAGTLDVSANLLFAAASTKGLISLVSVAGSLYPVITVLLARVLLHERVHRIQEAGVIAALGGVVLIAAG
ncbi:MAG TPA: EamA family transporter [Thermoleophilaceae bacterium]|nr:EamA family transporter [Thermoleophilaceae bacterium]